MSKLLNTKLYCDLISNKNFNRIFIEYHYLLVEFLAFVSVLNTEGTTVY